MLFTWFRQQSEEPAERANGAPFSSLSFTTCHLFVPSQRHSSYRSVSGPLPSILFLFLFLHSSFFFPSALLVAVGRPRVSCSSRSQRGLPVRMNDSALPAATWPTSKVPPLLGSGATSKVTARQKEVAGWWISNAEGRRKGDEERHAEKEKSVGYIYF